jgi:hypothetical protein
MLCKELPKFLVINNIVTRVETSAYFYMKPTLLYLGIIWSGGLLTAQVFKVVDLGTNRDFFLGVFAGCTTGLGIRKTSNPNNNDQTSPLEKDENGFY